MRHACRLPSALLALAIGVGSSLGLVAPARATLILALDLRALVCRADRIAVVDVISVQSFWNAGHERILSTVELSVVERWKGEAPVGARLTVVQPGGTVGEVTTTVSGMPRFTPGERMLIFLHGPTDRGTVVGLTQGKRTLRRDPGSGRWMVGAPDRPGTDAVRLRGTAAPPSVFEARERPLDEVRAQVTALAAAP